jgi:hypothetical protein
LLTRLDWSCEIHLGTTPSGSDGATPSSVRCGKRHASSVFARHGTAVGGLGSSSSGRVGSVCRGGEGIRSAVGWTLRCETVGAVVGGRNGWGGHGVGTVVRTFRDDTAVCSGVDTVGLWGVWIWG